ncbi:MAG TPA: hypothetical protein ENK39_09155 [Epsilonproteobacteria bacterium]|nr:hypothetical protein [Campylobacterota bacterium]
MNDTIKNMIADIEEMKSKLGEEIEKQEAQVSYKIKNGYVEFEKEMLSKQKENMKSLWEWFAETPFLHLLSSPVVYMMVFPAMLLDIMLFIYRKVVSSVFKFDFPKRNEYVVFDRQYLGYLNIMEKINCMYCSYFNGLMAYASAIASRTELYFCPIKHAKKVAYKHEYYDAFLGYGEEDKYQDKLKKLREDTLK